MSLWSAADDFDLAYDAYGSDTGGFTGRIGSDAFTSLSELNLNTRASECIEVGLSAFEASIAYPALPLTVYSPQDLRPSAEAALVDSGEAISGINSGFLGEGPDRGALEHGRGLPQYGPR